MKLVSRWSFLGWLLCVVATGYASNGLDRLRSVAQQRVAERAQMQQNRNWSTKEDFEQGVANFRDKKSTLVRQQQQLITVDITDKNSCIDFLYAFQEHSAQACQLAHQGIIIAESSDGSKKEIATLYNDAFDIFYSLRYTWQVVARRAFQHQESFLAKDGFLSDYLREVTHSLEQADIRVTDNLTLTVALEKEINTYCTPSNFGTDNSNQRRKRWRAAGFSKFGIPTFDTWEGLVELARSLFESPANYVDRKNKKLHALMMQRNNYLTHELPQEVSSKLDGFVAVLNDPNAYAREKAAYERRTSSFADRFKKNEMNLRTLFMRKFYPVLVSCTGVLCVTAVGAAWYYKKELQERIQKKYAALVPQLQRLPEELRQRMAVVWQRLRTDSSAATAKAKKRLAALYASLLHTLGVRRSSSNNGTAT